MGNFYTNVTVRHADPAAMASTLEALGRVAYVSPAEQDSVVVFDAATENQDIAALETLARELSGRRQSVALAVLNHDDDVLCYVLYQAGKELDRALVRPSPALAAIIGAEPIPYAEVMGKVFGYIRQHNLLDMSHPTAPAVVADEPLRQVFGVEGLPFSQLPFALDRHVTPL